MLKKIVIVLTAGAVASASVITPAEAAVAADASVAADPSAAAPSYARHFKSKKNRDKVYFVATAYMGQPYRQAGKCRRALHVKFTIKGDKYRRYAYTSKVSVNVVKAFTKKATIKLDGQKRSSATLWNLVDTDCRALSSRFVTGQSSVKLSTPVRSKP
ncbi:hypothetical protein SMC26_19700 [Actinomadura fulvescens]|uniref:Uncharacterized protein n=1 Tax=Actinomadura fulvescens TaxID=46160 RepID=A0ABN3PUC8_9ACTN